MLRVLPTEGLSILTKLKISIGSTPPTMPRTCVFMKHHFELILTRAVPRRCLMGSSLPFCYTLLDGSVTTPESAFGSRAAEGENAQRAVIKDQFWGATINNTRM
ncbi:hypothetical protein Zmor_009410 [Zophobas morio]|uniref:Uncharacterized protein n=1 Tax=Zophobas morio TaxID=2755281 RepID=A0AA38MIR8_9CUCU|nr:hypothetical protein Zmor_009410 [Zophobas morio]